MNKYFFSIDGRTVDLTRYAAERSALRPGDVVVFEGTRPISFAIRLFSGSSISHVAVVERAADGDADAVTIESTIEENENGVQSHPLGRVLAGEYPGGRAWALILKEDVRKRVDPERFRAFCAKSEGFVRYDRAGLVEFLLRSIPILGPRVAQREHADKMFCSGWAVELLTACGAIEPVVSSAKVTPQDVVEMGIFERYVQIHGSDKPLRRFASL